MTAVEDLFPGNPLVASQASLAAQSHVQTWIQATLREVALQTLLHCCSVQDDSTYQIHDDAVIQAQSACEMVADRWKDRLRDMGYHSAALWMDHVVEAGRESLFHNPPVGPSQQVRFAENRNEDSLTNGEPPQGAVTALGRLWSLECPELDDPNDELDLENAMQKLEAWGRAGHTDWPHDWDLVGRLVNEIPQRLYYKKKFSEDDDMDETDSEENEEQKKEKEMALIRKRKKRRGEDRERRIPKIPIAVPVPDEITRPPYDAPPRLKIPDTWDEEDLFELNSYLHSHDESPSITIIGALQDVGQYFCHQQKIKSDLENRTLKQQRTWQRDRVRQRLAGHKPVGHRELAGHRPSKSRVLQCQQDGNFFTDFDMSHCLLEWRNSTGNHILFFSNVEVVLKEEGPP